MSELSRAIASAVMGDERFTGLDAFDISTSDGRSAAEAFLQRIATGQDEQFKCAVIEVLRLLRDENDLDEAIAKCDGGLTERTGRRMAEYLQQIGSISHLLPPA